MFPDFGRIRLTFYLERSLTLQSKDLSALNGEHFWIAFRDTDLSDQRPPLKNFKDRGYEVRQVLQVEAAGQKAFLVELEHQLRGMREH